MKLSINKLLQNKIVLYIVLFFSVTSMFSYLMAQNYAAVLFFLLIAFLANYFSKNMILVLGIAVLSTNLLASVTNVFSLSGLREGLTSDSHYDDDDSDDDSDDDRDDDRDDKIKTDIKKAKKVDKKLEDATKQVHDDIENLEKDQTKKTCGQYLHKSACKDNDCKWAGGLCEKAPKSSFQNLNPASYSNSNKSKPNLDEAGTIESAYDNLENIIGTDSIRNMTADTQKLADRQKDLIEQLKNVAPLIGQTTKMISSFNMDGKLQGMIDGLTKNISHLKDSAP